jgi:hexosaminidase
MKKIQFLYFFLITSVGGVLAQNLDLIPQPVTIKEYNRKKVFVLPVESVLLLDKKLMLHSDFIATQFQKYTGKFPKMVTESLDNHPPFIFVIEEHMSIPKEGYVLKINKKGVSIKGKSVEGVLNGYQTLLQIFSSKNTQKGSLPFVKIKDFPAMEWRGMMLDVSRQFFDKEKVKQYIDWLAAHKINIFHWHLTDDNGWRIEIKALPELTLKGAWRGPGEVLLPSYGSGNKRYGGFYTQQDIREVVAFAKVRGVSIVPEIEIPGHSKAVIGSYPEIGCITSEQTKSVQGEVNNVWCVGREENYVLLETILNEVVDLFPFEYIHVAGDEVNTTTWKHCAKCTALMQKQGFTDAFQLQNYFFKRVETLIEKKNKKVIGWNEIIKGGQLSSNTAISAWQGVKYGMEALKLGHKTVMIPGQYTYFDMAQSDSERGHRWAGLIDTQKVYSFNPIPNEGLNAKEKKLILGVQGALWSEYLDRPERFMEYQSFPRIAALAEIGWSQNKHKDWDDFYKRLTHSHFNRLENMGIAFRNFPPKAFYDKGQITVELPYPNATVRYTDDGSEPTQNSLAYESPIVTQSYENYRFRAFFGSASKSPVVTVKLPALASWKSTKQETISISKDCSSFVNQTGIWILNGVSKNERSNNGTCNRIAFFENNLKIFEQTEKIEVKKLSSFKIPILNYDPSYEYRIEIEIENQKGADSEFAFFLEHSPYVEPEVKVSSSLEERSNFKLQNLEDYNIESYFRSNRPCEKGVWILFSFSKPIAASQIEILTGIPHHPRFIINEGHVEYTYDGISFEKGPDFEYGLVSIFPKQPVLGVKIVIEANNNEPTVAIQDLKIKPKKE